MNDYADDYMDEEETIEGYCMRCRESVEMEEAMPVWTRRGMPAARGVCPICGGTVFRMGKTHMHNTQNRPDAIEIGDSGRRKRPKLERDTVYINYAAADEALAQQIADDLEKIGIAIWLHEDESADSVNWAGGAHPALKECAQMVYVLSPTALAVDAVAAAWQFFREKRKPIIIAQVQSADPPDPIRRSPRFDFTGGDYKATFRQMVHELTR